MTSIPIFTTHMPQLELHIHLEGPISPKIFQKPAQPYAIELLTENGRQA